MRDHELPPHAIFVAPRETKRRGLTQALADSNVSAVAIALLLLWSLDATFRGLWDPAYRVGTFVLTAIAIWDIPYHSPTLSAIDRLTLISTFYFLYSAIACLSAAWLVARWVYGMGPLRSLAACLSRFMGSRNA